MRRVIYFFFCPNEQRAGGGGGRCQTFYFYFCFSLLLPYYKNPFLDLGKNIVKGLGQCFLPELAN